MITKIYALYSSEDSTQIRYIGKTELSFQWRLDKHLYETKLGKTTHKCNWIRDSLQKGFNIYILLLGESTTDWRIEESAWIAYGRAEGWKLTNGTDGGEGWHPSDETKKKMSIAHKGKRNSPEHCKNISIGKKGKPQTPEARRINSISHSGKNHCNYGHHRSESTKQKLRISAINQWKRRKEAKVDKLFQNNEIINSGKSNVPTQPGNPQTSLPKDSENKCVSIPK